MPARSVTSSPQHGPPRSGPDIELEPPHRGTEWLWRAGRTSWSVLALLALLVVAGYVMGRLSLVVVPVVLALFPATLLWPLARALKRRGIPAALAALSSILAGLLLFAAVIGAMVPLVVADLPELTDSAAEGVAAFEDWLVRGPFGIEVDGLSDLLTAAQEQLGEVGDLAPQALAAATTAFETLAGIVLLFAVLFFYLKDGPRVSEGIVSILPVDIQDRVRGAAARSWLTLGIYFRWLLVVALVDAVLIGVGLLVLQVPLAVPLAVLVFFGGLFPIVGAVMTGALAVLVALADAGLGIGLAVLALVLVVQQLESNVLQPIVQSRAVHLHALVVLLSVTAGAILLGILGAFLAVPMAAIVAGTLRYLSSDGGDESPPAAARAKAAEVAGEKDAAQVADNKKPPDRGGKPTGRGAEEQG